MSKFHWLLLLLMAQCFYLIATAPGVWSSLFPLAILLYLTWQYAKEHGDKTYISEAFDLGFKLAEKHNDIQKDLDFLYDRCMAEMESPLTRLKVKGDIKKGQGVCIGLKYNIPTTVSQHLSTKKTKKVKKSTKKRK